MSLERSISGHNGWRAGCSRLTMPPRWRRTWKPCRLRRGDVLAQQGAASAELYFPSSGLLAEASVEVTADGSLGPMYVGAVGAGFLRLLETPDPLRNSIHAGPRPWIFELDRTRYLAGRSVCLVTFDHSTLSFASPISVAARDRPEANAPQTAGSSG
jgi:hypothetical protein